MCYRGQGPESSQSVAESHREQQVGEDQIGNAERGAILLGPGGALLPQQMKGFRGLGPSSLGEEWGSVCV